MLDRSTRRTAGGLMVALLTLGLAACGGSPSDTGEKPETEEMERDPEEGVRKVSAASTVLDLSATVTVIG